MTTVHKNRARYWNSEYGSTSPPGLWAPAGFVLSFALPFFFYSVLPEVFPVSPLDRVVLVGKLQLWPAGVFLLFIFLSGLPRVQSSPAAAHDPAIAHKLNDMPVTYIAALRAISNTLEQYVLHLGAMMGLALHIDAVHLKIIPALTATWCIGRILYYVGYTSDSGHRRMIGFVPTLLPSVAALGYATYLALTQNGFY
jgi:hypothetical protein